MSGGGSALVVGSLSVGAKGNTGENSTVRKHAPSCCSTAATVQGVTGRSLGFSAKVGEERA